ncbi:MAG: hypothetical protein KGQ58_08185 [Proteobacteria bacterium]|nr:hypothetical protein [Pseudomonadota bacterium]MDE3208600.1 hypothetical protein [Pseudomonadota bacterium]
MLNARLSRWTMTYFSCALINFILALGMMVSGHTYPALSFSSPSNLIAVHLMTIGWLSLLMLGALAQFVPVITNNPLPSQPGMLAGLILLEAGLLNMVMGFLALNGSFPLSMKILLPIGGTLVLTGFFLDIWNIAVPLVRTRPIQLPAKMLLTSLGFLILTLCIGLCFAIGFGADQSPLELYPLLSNGLPIHILAGLVGWLGFTAIGVGYKLLPMFMLAPEDRGHWGTGVWGTLATGLTLFVLTGLFNLWFPNPILHTCEKLGLILLISGLVIYIVDITRLYHSRQRKTLELNSTAAAMALTLFAPAILTGAAAIFDASSFLPATVFIFMFGYLSGLGLSQLYKIVPFLTWLDRFGIKLGQGPVPRVQDLVIEARAKPWFIIYFAGVAINTSLLFWKISSMFELVAFIQLIAVLALIREFWHARHPDQDLISKKPRLSPNTLEKISHEPQ